MEDFLLMSALKVEVGLRIPPAAGTWARNDLYTGPPTPCRQSRNTPSWAAASLPQMSGTTATPPLPNSKPLQNKPPTAEKLAYDYLEAGDTSLWTAIQHLQYEPLQRFHQQPDVTGQTKDKGQFFRSGHAEGHPHPPQGDNPIERAREELTQNIHGRRLKFW